jgi:hypothetical protein
VPIVFIAVIDPVGSGLVSSLARPSGNATGFVSYEYALAAKWLELLQEFRALKRLMLLEELNRRVIFALDLGSALRWPVMRALTWPCSQYRSRPF